MKATLKIRNSARVIATAFAMLIATVFTTMVSASESNSGYREVKAAVNRLEKYNQVIEASITYTVPEVNETAALDLDLAWLRLEENANIAESAAQYVAPVVAEDITVYEVNAALENLAQLNQQVEYALRFTAPSIVD